MKHLPQPLSFCLRAYLATLLVGILVIVHSDIRSSPIQDQLNQGHAAFVANCSDRLALVMSTNDPNVAVAHLDHVIRYLDEKEPVSRANLSRVEYQRALAIRAGLRDAQHELRAAQTSLSEDSRRTAMIRAHQLLSEARPTHIPNAERMQTYSTYKDRGTYSLLVLLLVSVAALVALGTR